jgi:hypothetical protein
MGIALRRRGIASWAIGQSGTSSTTSEMWARDGGHVWCAAAAIAIPRHFTGGRFRFDLVGYIAEALVVIILFRDESGSPPSRRSAGFTSRRGSRGSGIRAVPYSRTTWPSLIGYKLGRPVFAVRIAYSIRNKIPVALPVKLARMSICIACMLKLDLPGLAPRLYQFRDQRKNANVSR